MFKLNANGPGRRRVRIDAQQRGRYNQRNIFHSNVEPMGLRTMISLQQEVREYLTGQGIGYVDHTTSFKALDFTIGRDGMAYFELEVKEKRQPYRADRWPISIPEPDLFILDDLTVRKCLRLAPRSGVLVRDSCRSRYGFFSVVDLALMPRVRVNREIDRGTKAFKGKWMVDLNNSALSNSLDGAFQHIRTYLMEMDSILSESLPCYGAYLGEEIVVAGETRQPRHWEVDVQATR